MEEIEKARMTRTKKTNGSEVHQVMTALTDTTIRGIVRSANEEGIKREDIVSLLKENGQFVLIYFKQKHYGNGRAEDSRKTLDE